MKKVSVIVPIYNAKKYIDRCIQSLVCQTLKEIEIILVDDGSTDGSEKICDVYEKKYDNIKVIHKKNEGAGIARNYGLNIATGKYVAFLDSDDYVDNRMYEILYDQSISNNTDGTFCGSYKVIGENVVKNNNVDENIVIDRDVILRESIPYLFRGGGITPIRATIAVWRGIYKLRVIKENNINFNSEREFFSEDTIFNLDFFLKSDKIAFCKDYLHYQYISDNSLSRSTKINYIAVDNYYNYLKNIIIENDQIDKNKCMAYLSKRCLEEYRSKIAMELKTNANRKQVKINIKKITNDKTLKEIIKRNNNIFDYKDKLFILLVRLKSYMFFYIVFKVFKNTKKGMN